MMKSMNENYKNYNCVFLKWDTKYFGYKSARIDIVGPLKKEDKKKILEYCNKHEYITIANVGNIPDTNYWIGTKLKAFLSDINIQFQKKINKQRLNLMHKVRIANNVSYDSRIVKIASDNFEHSRFFNDPNLPKVKSEKIYESWTINSFDLPNKFFAVVEKNDEVAGYLLFSIEGKTGTIELIVVNTEYQSQSIGTEMILSVENYLYEKDMEHLKVGTQLENIKAVNFYSDNGFDYIYNTSIYHLWNIDDSGDKH